MKATGDYPERGKLLAQYRRPDRSAWQRAGLAVLAGMVIVFVGWGVNATLRAVQTYGPAAAFSESKAWYLAGAIGMIFLLGAWYVSGTRRSAILVYERALVLLGGEERQVAWSEIAGVSFREVRYRLGRTRHDASLVLNDGQRIDLSNWLSGQRLVDLVVHIKARTYRRLDGALRGQIQAGEWVDFGRLSISRMGVKVKGSQYSWDEIQTIKFANGTLRIELQEGKGYEIGAEAIPNPELLLRIADDVGGRHEA